MLRKLATALLAIAILSCTMLGTAVADQSTDDILIKKGENSDNVILLQMRLCDLGYYDYKITGFFGDFTANALKDFQKTNGITADGIAGKKTLDALYSNSAKTKPIEPRVKPKPKPKPKKVKFGEYLDWFNQVQYMWKRGEVCVVTDLDTGISYKMKRVGGSYHADVAPINKTENRKFENTYGGNYPNWDRRAVVVNIHGVLVAGSTNGYPHGSTGVPGNGMNLASGHLQQVCIHFKNSRTHIHNMVDPAHQYEVRRAAGLKNNGPRPALADPD